MNMLENKEKVLFEEHPKYINGHICIKTDTEIRIAFIEEKISQEDDEIILERKYTNQIVMTKENARKLAESIEQTLL